MNITDLKQGLIQKQYQAILRMTNGLPSAASKLRPSLYFFTSGEEEDGNHSVKVMWGNSEKEAKNRLIFSEKMNKPQALRLQSINAAPPFPEGMNGWSAEFALFRQDELLRVSLERWAKKAVKEHGTGANQTVS